MIQARFKTGYYKPPARPGVSYMMSPILRTYVNPDHGDRVETTNNPHVMHYAPNLTNADIGGVAPAPVEFQHFFQHGRWIHNPDPFIISQGPHGYLIQHLVIAERDAIDSREAKMLDQLCKLKSEWCLKR